MKPSLSAVLIARDEARDLPGCLESLRGLADEVVVVVDERSTDETESLARLAGAKVTRRVFDDYASQREASLALASKDWCLWIDCDERVTPELREELLRRLAEPGDAAAYEIPFAVRFLGRRLRHGGLGSETHVRVFRRGRARFTGGALHEGLAVDGRVARTAAGIDHEPYRDLSDYLGKLDAYTTLAARKRFAAGRRFHCWRHLLLPWEFFSRAVLKLGLLDGRAGLAWAGLAAFHSWLKYVKLGELENENRP